MSKLSYAKLLVDMYQFPKLQTEHITSMLTADDVAAIEKTIAVLREKERGDWLETVIRQYHGIGCDPQTMRVIGASLEQSVSGGYIQQLRTYAYRYMCRVVELRPLVERITAAGIMGNYYRLRSTVNLPQPEQLKALQEVALAPHLAAITSDGTFIVDCFPTCVPENRCPSCRAKAILAEHGLVSEFETLAREWMSGPTTDWRSISLRSLEFSVRTANCFINEEMHTLGQLCAKSEAELLRMSNFGRASLNEVREFLAAMNLRLCDR